MAGGIEDDHDPSLPDHGGGTIGGGGEDAPDTHLAPGRRLTFGLQGNREEVVYQGDYAALRTLADSVEIGKVIDAAPSGGTGGVETTLPQGSADSESSTGGSTGVGYAKPFNVQLSRTNGNRGQLVVSFSQNRQVALWTVDFVEVSKPIRTWHADKPEGKPDLAQIRQWEQNETANPGLYWAFKKDAANALTGDTLELAKMISQGIDTYSLYVPVVTCTVNLAEPPDLLGNAPGVIDDPAAPNGWRDANDHRGADIIGNLVNPRTGTEYEWLLSAVKVSTNSDGTYQLTKSWQAADSIDERLYGGGDQGGGQDQEGDPEGGDAE